MRMMKRLRVMELISRAHSWNLGGGRRGIARSQAGPQNVECRIDALRQRGIAKNRPEQERAENGLAENIGELRSGEILANFAAVLSQLDELGEQTLGACVVLGHGLPDRGTREMRLKNGPNNGGVSRGFLGHASA